MKAKIINQIVTLFIIWFLFLCLNHSVFAADTASAKYFPLAVGNSYTYRNTFFFGPETRTRASITRDTVINGKKYFYCQNFPDIGTGWVRYDSARSNLLKYSLTNSCSNYINETIVDSLAMSVNNSINCQSGVIYTRRCTGTGSQILFGESRPTKSFIHDGLIYSMLTYASGIGLVSYCSGEPPPCQGYTNLIGYVLNGNVFGDTLLTDIEQTSTIIPDKFYLAQNFPNPFNPETRISFAIPENSFVTLKIYNTLGIELTSLINEKLNIGNYNYTWSGVNLPSGTYYYKLEAGSFSETKKMILMK